MIKLYDLIYNLQFLQIEIEVLHLNNLTNCHRKPIFYTIFHVFYLMGSNIYPKLID